MAKINFKYFNTNKYKNKSCKCNQNHIHHSRGEARYCDRLAFEKRVGLIEKYTTQKRFDLYVNGKKITTHIPDFFVTTKENKQEVHEYKGYPDKVWPIKMKLFQAIYPDIKYIVVRG
jgi:hypothetical protein